MLGQTVTILSCVWEVSDSNLGFLTSSVPPAKCREHYQDTQNVPEGKVNILGGHSIGHSKQKIVYVHVPYSEQFPRWGYFTLQFQNCW
jgi:hypothetical protein